MHFQLPNSLSDVKIPDFNNSIFKGISDHSLGISAALKACAFGAEYLEKHFTFDKNLQKSNEKGHLGGMDAEDLKTLKKLHFRDRANWNKPNKIKLIKFFKKY